MPKRHPTAPAGATTHRAALIVALLLAGLAAGPARAQNSPPVPAAAARAELERGRAADSAGRADEARRRYTAALALDPAYVDASIALATALIEVGDAGEAREVIARAIKRTPDDPRLRNLRIRRRSAAGADTSAAGRVTNDRKLRAANPDDEGTALALAQVLAARGDHRGAAALFDTLLVGPAPSERVATAAVRQALTAGDSARARSLLARTRRRYPGSSELAAVADSLGGGAAPR